MAIPKHTEVVALYFIGNDQEEMLSIHGLVTEKPEDAMLFEDIKEAVKVALENDLCKSLGMEVQTLFGPEFVEHTLH